MKTLNWIASALKSFLSIFGLMFEKFGNVFFKKRTFIGKEAYELLNDPSTRDEFIQFTKGMDTNGNELSTEEKTFTKTNGKQITLMNIS